MLKSTYGADTHLTAGFGCPLSRNHEKMEDSVHHDGEAAALGVGGGGQPSCSPERIHVVLRLRPRGGEEVKHDEDFEKFPAQLTSSAEKSCSCSWAKKGSVSSVMSSLRYYAFRVGVGWRFSIFSTSQLPYPYTTVLCFFLLLSVFWPFGSLRVISRT